MEPNDPTLACPELFTCAAPRMAPAHWAATTASDALKTAGVPGAGVPGAGVPDAVVDATGVAASNVAGDWHDMQTMPSIDTSRF